MPNYKIIEDGGLLYIEFFYDLGKVKIRREFLGVVKEDFQNGLISRVRPNFKLFEDEEIIEDDLDNIYIVNRKTREIKFS